MGDRTYRLPKAVYFQCIWTVKDIERLRRLTLAAEANHRENEIVFFEVDEDAVTSNSVLNQAMYKLDCISRALEDVPSEYRRGTIDTIVDNTPFTDLAHENTWRKWRRVFIRNLAKELELI